MGGTNKESLVKPTFDQISPGENVTYSVTYRGTERAINRIEQGMPEAIMRKRKSPNLLDLQGFSDFVAEKEGFEPSLRFTRTTPLAGQIKPLQIKPLKPAGHLYVTYRGTTA